MPRFTQTHAPKDPEPEPVPAHATIERSTYADDMHDVFDGAAQVVRKPACHCGGELVPHTSVSGPKVGAEHCSTCGCCLVDGEPRPGTEPCNPSLVPA